MAPVVTSYTPTTGPATGGTLITITGTGLDTVDQVNVNNKAGAIVGTPTPTTLTFRTPSAAAAGNAVVHVIDNDTNTEVAAATPYAYTAVGVSEKQTVTTQSKWKVDVDSSPGLDGSAYIPFGSIQDIQPALPATMQDSTTLDGNGYGGKAKTQLDWSLTLKVLRTKGLVSKAYNPGQEVVRLAAESFDQAALVRVRWYDRFGGPEAYEGYGYPEWAPDGGAPSALSTVSCTINGDGERVKIANPAAS